MPPKRKARSGTLSETNSEQSGKKPPAKRARRKTKEDGTIWVDDDTLPPEDDNQVITLTLQIVDDDEDDDSDYVPGEESEDDEEFIQYLLDKYVGQSSGMFPPPQKRTTRRSAKKEELPIRLTDSERAYYDRQTPAKKKELLDLMVRVSNHVLDEGEIPFKFRILNLPISDYVKSSVIKKIATLDEIQDQGGEGHKLRNWVDAFMRIPFGKTVPLPVTIADGPEKCSEFMTRARKQMDKHVYGMEPAKLQLMQIIAQWIVNPTSVGNVIALAGPPGIGKTTIARTAIAQVLQRPFEFFTLGGASDIANYIGHSYTYEGSLWGRVADSLMHAKTMNPVMYFDELDKISTTPQGDEIVSMLIHMTDRSQNSQFHDRYFAGVDFDLSQCLFVFSFNDIDKVHPILRDRMTIIQCGGYSEKEKAIILRNYIWKEILERLRFKDGDITLTDSAVQHIISEYSSEEKGVRTLIRTVERMMTRINMLRLSNDPSMKDYKFYMDIKFPLTITEEVVKKVLCDVDVKKGSEDWRSLYT